MKFTTYSSTILIMVFFLFCFVTPLQAMTIWNESVNGDLADAGTYSGFESLAFDIGINTILGNETIGDTSDGSSSYDYDPFTFLLPTGTQLVGVTYTILDLEETGSISNASKYYRIADFDPPWPNLTDPEEIQIELSSVSLFEDFLPLSPSAGVWLNAGSGFSGTVGIADSVNWNYQIDFQVSAINPVPEPSTMVLLTFGMAGLAGVTRKKLKK